MWSFGLMHCGSANLIQPLLRRGLIDQMNIWTYPLIIGKGK